MNRKLALFRGLYPDKHGDCVAETIELMHCELETRITSRARERRLRSGK